MTLSTADLERLMRRALVRRGLSDAHAQDVTSGLIETSLRGNDTHGIRLFPTYLAELEGGRSRPRPDFRWHQRSTTSRVLDADDALGPVAALTAAREAVHLAKEHGTGAVAVRRSNYFGASSQYTLEMARQDTLGLCCTNSDALVAPVGGTRPLFGTNPISFAVRGEDDDLFCIDMATSQASFTQIRQRRRRGIPLEPGWAVLADGRDAAEAAADEEAEIAALLPLGGHKGQCLAMLVEILCCLLADMPFDHELTHLYDKPFDQPRVTSHFLLALDIAAFQSLTRFRSRLSELLRIVRAEGREGSPVMAPGDFESSTFSRRREESLPLTDSDRDWVERLQAEEGNAEERHGKS